jgi:uncharacterized protein YecE (DUF72 family)
MAVRPKKSAAPGTASSAAPAAPPPDAFALELAREARPLFIGTSGFSYTEWRGFFYPDKLPAKQFLSFYSGIFPTTEINNTFYRIPRPALTEQWAAEVPAGFRFTLKLSQRVTHIKRLKDVDQEMSWFTSAALGLGDKLGPVLVQLPPNFKKDAARLSEFLDKQAPRLRLALEFRHASWFDDEVFEILRGHDTAFAVVEREEGETLPQPRLVTGSFVYMRLRKGELAAGEWSDWAAWIRSQVVPVYCYLKHDERSPDLARRLVQALRG